MKKAETPSVYFDGLWNFFTSVKLTVIVLMLLAVTSGVGTVIPQNGSPADYIHRYGNFLYNLFNLLDIFDMYRSWWFRFLILILTINIVVCSTDRLSATWKVIFVKTPSFVLSSFRKISHKEMLVAEKSPEQLKNVYEPFISKNFGYSTVEKTDNGFCIFAEKGRWTRLGVYIVHISVVLLLLGGLIGSIFGFEGFVNIPEGEMTDHIRLKKGNEIHQLDFQIRCDDFDVSFYDSGAPKEYRSTLTLIEKEHPVLKKDIIVNDPLRYKGINIFQSSYGTLPPADITLNFTSKATGMVYTQKASVGQPFDIPEDMGSFVVRDFSDSYNFMGHNIGECFVGTLTQDEKDPLEIVIPFRYPKFDAMRKGDFIVSVTDYHKRHYTGLQVTKDPGVLVVYAGFVIMIIGFFVAFFMSHQKICIEISEKKGKSEIEVSGNANKNKMAMEGRIKKLSQRLADLART